MTDRPSWPDYWLAFAALAATRGTCVRRQAGCVLVDAKERIISTGYNGAPSAQEHCTDVGCYMVDRHCERTVHAEQNALIQADPSRLDGATAYVTCQPCHRCDLLLRQAGVVRIYWPKDSDYVDRVRDEA